MTWLLGVTVLAVLPIKELINKFYFGSSSEDTKFPSDFTFVTDPNRFLTVSCPHLFETVSKLSEMLINFHVNGIEIDWERWKPRKVRARTRERKNHGN